MTHSRPRRGRRQLSISAVLMVLIGLGALVLCREYLGSFMTWLAHLHGWHGPVLFGVLFILVRRRRLASPCNATCTAHPPRLAGQVSFPMMWGYIVLNVAAGYLYGLWLGLLLTSVSATVGALVSFVLCRRFFVECVAGGGVAPGVGG